eukprot:TRINITY_DN2145_c0_g1_i1.p1 TRINITY_DN2145_c0_g1~~TRINITY_DN2145_c0_g1_i1.p1  ORF type:complete len:155 (+),score=44.63 TRINITY_DN2145_c0_g1_i1:47-511(+)
MSWQDYLQQYLIDTKKVDQAFICSIEDGSVVASTEEFFPRYYTMNLMQDDGTEKEEVINEQTNLLQIMADPTNWSSCPQGLRLNGRKYMVTRPFEEAIYASLKLEADEKKAGLCLAKTATLVICGTYDEGKDQMGGNCNMAVEGLADYLRESGY